jgi:hypothetical protein
MHFKGYRIAVRSALIALQPVEFICDEPYLIDVQILKAYRDEDKISV